MDTTDLLAELSLRNPLLADPRHLGRHQAKVYSQNGEDGVIAEIFHRIGTTNRLFLEIGVEGGLENNSRLLLESGWRGVWIEGGEKEAAAARERFAAHIRAGRLKVVQAFATRENIGALCAEAGLPAEVDFVSVDIDFNTGHLWDALPVRGRAACIEYNANLPAPLDLCVPYDPAGVWTGSHWYGHSLKALERIGRGKGMALVGCEFVGVNAFFVAEAELADRFLGPFTAETHYEAPKYRLGNWRIGHPPAPAERRWVEGPG